MVPSFLLLSQTYHNSRCKLAGKGNSGGGYEFQTLKGLKGLCVRKVTSCLSPYMKDETGGI